MYDASTMEMLRLYKFELTQHGFPKLINLQYHCGRDTKHGVIPDTLPIRIIRLLLSVFFPPF